MEFVVFAGMLLACAYFMFWPAMFKAENRRKRAAYAGYQPPRVMGIADELFNPSAAQALQVQEAQITLPAPAPTPGDPPDLETGRIRIEL